MQDVIINVLRIDDFGCLVPCGHILKLTCYIEFVSSCHASGGSKLELYINILILFSHSIPVRFALRLVWSKYVWTSFVIAAPLQLLALLYRLY